MSIRPFCLALVHRGAGEAAAVGNFVFPAELYGKTQRRESCMAGSQQFTVAERSLS